jgi:hypothetical protein
MWVLGDAARVMFAGVGVAGYSAPAKVLACVYWLSGLLACLTVNRAGVFLRDLSPVSERFTPSCASEGAKEPGTPRCSGCRSRMM